jgi:viroplasmin and RNaseH domain-containing protein
MWAIKFRNGSFFQSLEVDNGGPKATAALFDSKEEAEAFMRENAWICFNGGMAFEVGPKEQDGWVQSG